MIPLAPEAIPHVRAWQGRPREPAAGWLAGQGRAGTLLAPASWHDAVAARVGPVEPARVETRSLVAFDPARALQPPRPAVPLVQVTLEDGAGFVGSAPAWALRGWGSYPEL